MEYWSVFLEWNLGGKFWSETKNAIWVVYMSEPFSSIGVLVEIKSIYMQSKRK